MKLEDMKEELVQFEIEGRLRSIETTPEQMTNFSSNDYLSLASQKSLREEFWKQYGAYDLPLSSSSSRLIDGSYSIVMDLEKKLEEIYQKAALCFNSGFDANSSVIETLFPKKSLILTDRLNHASIYDGIVASDSKFLRYQHLDMAALEALLQKYQTTYEDILIISESVYSMDGDCADIKALVELKKKYNAQLMIDEAHSYGVHSYGICYEEGLLQDIDYLILPLGKAGASIGSYVLCDEIVKQYLINKSRKFIYSTALPPINHAWNLFLLEKMPSFHRERKALQERQELLYSLLADYKIPTESTTHIISIIIGENQKAMKLGRALSQKGFFIKVIKEPTVPKGTARLRLSLTASIPMEEIKRFAKELKYEMDLLV